MELWSGGCAKDYHLNYPHILYTQTHIYIHRHTHTYIHRHPQRWSNFIRMHIDKKECHFFMVNLSSLLALIFMIIACFFLLLKFKLLIDNWTKNEPKGVPKSQNIFFTFGHNSWWKNTNVLFSKLYTVSKNRISPQQKLGSLWNWKL